MEELIRELRCVMYSLKRIGQRTEPCATPQVRMDEGKDEVEWQQKICETASMS